MSEESLTNLGLKRVRIGQLHPREFVIYPGVSTTNNPPPSANSEDPWGFYFSSATLTDDQEKAVLDGLTRAYKQRADLIMAPWDIADPNYGQVERAFGVTQPPAFIITKPWFGELFANEDWSKILSYAEKGEMPVHVVLQGTETFKDVTTLVGTIEQLNILFAGHTDEIEQTLQERDFDVLVQNIGTWVGGVFKSIQFTFGVGPFTATVGYDKGGGATVSVGPKPKDGN